MFHAEFFSSHVENVLMWLQRFLLWARQAGAIESSDFYTNVKLSVCNHPLTFGTSVKGQLRLPYCEENNKEMSFQRQLQKKKLYGLGDMKY